VKLPAVFVYAWRTIRKSPAFSATAVLTIALGIGASTAVFSVTNAVLLQALPYGQPDRLVLAVSDLRTRNVKDWPFSNADYFDLRNNAKSSFEDFAAVSTGRALWLKEDNTPEQIRTAAVTPNFFPLMKAKIALGRDFSAADGIAQPPAAPGAPDGGAVPPLPNIAILSYEYWQRRYGGNPAVLGTTSNGAQIVGVVERNFELLFPPGMNIERPPDVWFAARLPYDAANRTPKPEWVEILGVVEHQRTTSLAEEGREQIYFTDGFLGHGAAFQWAVRTAGTPSQIVREAREEIARFNPQLLIDEVQPMEVLVGRAQAQTRFSLFLIGVLAAIAAFLAGVGLYGVMSTIVRQRTAEIGVRMAVGADTVRIVRLVVGQGLLLSGSGIAGGLLVAYGLTSLMTSMLVDVKATDPLTFAAMAMIFFAIAGVACWLPARRAAGLDPMAALREE
jgi:hypothetical protein